MSLATLDPETLEGDAPSSPSRGPATVSPRALTLLQGDALTHLRALPAGSVQCCVTSPPYFALRDYGVAPQAWEACSFLPMAGLGLGPLEVPAMSCALGLEPTIPAFLAHLVLIFREVRRVLKKDGTLWMNFGDSYAGSGQGFGDKRENPNSVHNTNGAHRASQGVRIGSQNGDSGHSKYVKPPAGLKAKDAIGMPWRVAFALQADGWYLRSDIIWHKPNPMPSSQRDRPTVAHEYLFLLSKSPRYYYDGDAIREPASPSTHARLAQDVEHQIGSARANGGAKTNGNMKAVARKRRPSGWAESDNGAKAGRYARPKDNDSFDSALAQHDARGLAQRANAQGLLDQ